MTFDGGWVRVRVGYVIIGMVEEIAFALLICAFLLITRWFGWLAF